MRRAFVLALSAFVLFAAGSAWLSLYPAIPDDLGGVKSLDAVATRVDVPVGGDDHVTAWVVPGSDRAVIVLCPGYARDHRRVWRYANFLKPDGYTLVALDFRSARASGRKPTTLGAYEQEDLDAVLRWVAAQPRWAGAKVGLFGESLGGATVLAVAAAHPEVAAAVADCPFATGELAVRDGFACRLHLPAWPLTPIALAFGKLATNHDLGALDVRAALRALGDRPVLLIQTALGDRFAKDQVRALENAAGSGAEGWTVDDSRHNHVWLDHRREYEGRVRAFFAPHLLGRRAVTLERVDAPAVAATGGAR